MNKIIAITIAFVVVISCGTNKKITTTKSKSTTHTKRTPVKKQVVTPSTAHKNEVLVSTSRTEVSTDIIYEYVLQYKDIAMQNMRDFKIPASIILAQGILESGSGRGLLSSKSNNHFGIKCHTGWTGDTTTHDDDQKGECFRKYNDPADSYRDHAMFLTARSRYSTLFELDIEDYEAWAKGLREAGYATDRAYPQKLIGLIERYELHQYDQQALNKIMPIKAPVKMVEVQKQVTSVPVAVTPKTEQASNSNINTDNLYKVSPGDTLYSISKRFGVSVDQLVKLNNIIDNSIAIGQILKIK